MPKGRWGAGRACLVVGADGAVGAIAGALSAAGFAAKRVAAEAEALAELETGPFAAVVASQKLGPVAVAGIVARAAQQYPLVPTVVVGAIGSVQEAVDAMQLGAADYLVAPVEDSALLQRLRRVLERVAEPSPAGTAMDFMGLVGTSAAMRRLLGTIDRISRYKANVLLLGESGTGKELIARALHARGPRHGSLFVPVNCATLGHDILENELFGHERGAFTGAVTQKRGLVEAADGGTLLLDEVAELPLVVQAKLLTFLDDGAFRRVGSVKRLTADVRIIAATNVDLERAVVEGRFRRDLFFRLRVFPIL
ncbi:MAG TPA: sigma 54-interacting transcriptional regulator, partial [Myxococcales bacterium]|nr:sigma 54-interacting transcriptional regulator [Myxococcales bacterium]